MKPRTSRLIFMAAILGVALALAALIVTAPKHPVALIRVVDAAGNPVAGAIITPEGMRTKPGPYRSGWYGWRPDANGVPNPPVATEKNGYARIPYPEFVFEQIETGTLCLAVNHPDYVPDRPERIVATTPPAGTPWKVRLNDLLDRIRHKTLLARPDPIVLQRGVILKVTVPVESANLREAHLFVQVSGLEAEDSEFWTRPEPGVIITRRLAEGPHTVRAAVLDSEGSTWFSEVFSITATTGETNGLVAPVKRGAIVRGQLDDSVPRPVKNGRVVAHVWPRKSRPQENPPQWHAWAAVREDGSFAIHSLPEGELEIVALCDGFISTNGPGQFQMRYPQKHLIGANDLAITLGMEQTARLEVTVTDDAGRPLKDVRVIAWPNVRYGEWSATVFASDCYNTSDFLLMTPEEKKQSWKPVPDFEGISDDNGLAVLANLPPDVKELAVDHPQFTLPAFTTPDGRKHREATLTLFAGKTNRMILRLEPRERSTITHY